MGETVYAGIDVSLDTLTVAVYDQPSWDDPREFANNQQGHRQLLRFLKRAGGKVQACLEPTSTYHLVLSHALCKLPGCTVYLADPRAVKDFAAARIKRAKTDRCDARELALFVKMMEPVSWQPPSQELLDLRCLARRAAEVTQRRTGVKNRLHAAKRGLTPKVLLADLERELREQLKRLERLRAEMLAIVRSNVGLKRRYQLLISVYGIGMVTALKLLAELSLLSEDMDKRQWTAAAGLDPQPRESGKSVHHPRRISRRGNKHLRQALFIPALVASGKCQQVKQYYEMLQKRGVAKMAALCAIMRKLLQAIWGMFDTNTPFKPELFYRN